MRTLLWSRVLCPLSQSRPRLSTNRVFILNFPPFHQCCRSEHFKWVVLEELLSQLILQIRNQEWLFGNSGQFFKEMREVEFQAGRRCSSGKGQRRVFKHGLERLCTWEAARLTIGGVEETEEVFAWPKRVYT